MADEKAEKEKAEAIMLTNALNVAMAKWKKTRMFCSDGLESTEVALEIAYKAGALAMYQIMTRGPAFAMTDVDENRKPQ